MRLMGLMGLMGLMVSCSDDAPEQRGNRQKVELIPYYNNYKVSDDEQGTRGERNTTLFGNEDGDGPFMTYTKLYPQADPYYSKIQVYMTTADDSKIATQGSFSYSDITKTWSSNVWVQAEKQYYLYGFMPISAVENASLTQKDGSFANQAVLKLNGLDAVTPADVCIVVGVKGQESYTDIAESGIGIGEFGYYGDQSDQYYICLLLDHLYACINLEYLIGTEYSKLRSIKLRKVEIHAGAPKHNLTITIDKAAYLTAYNEAVSGGTTNPIDVQPFTVTNDTETQEASRTAVVFDKTGEDEGVILKTDLPQSVPGYFTPTFQDKFIITSTYDVYDRKGNLIRANQESVNTIKLSPAYTNIRGKIYTLKFIVEPTYLYKLSEEDLDNPTIKVGS